MDDKRYKYGFKPNGSEDLDYRGWCVKNVSKDDLISNFEHSLNNTEGNDSWEEFFLEHWNSPDEVKEQLKKYLELLRKDRSEKEEEVFEELNEETYHLVEKEQEKAREGDWKTYCWAIHTYESGETNQLIIEEYKEEF